MATASSLSPSPVSILQLPPAPDGRVRFSREAYYRMFEIGVLNRDRRFELLDGEIVMMSPIGPDQSGLIGRLNRFFMTNMPDSIDCRIQSPIVLSDRSEPEPDVALVRRQSHDYRAAHPHSADVLLVVEVSQSSFARDRGQKLQMYAQAGITEYWIVDVDRQIIVVHRNPVATGYETVEQFAADATIAPLAAPNCRLDVGWLFH